MREVVVWGVISQNQLQRWKSARENMPQIVVRVYICGQSDLLLLAK
jgi:hypothetical protein